MARQRNRPHVCLGGSRNLGRKLGRRSLPVTTDVTKPADIDELVKQTVDEFGAIDILVNNAGISARKLVVEQSDEDWDRVLDTNLKSCFLCSRAAGKIMLEQKRGNIISIASLRGIKRVPGTVGYSVSKAGVIMLTVTGPTLVADGGIAAG